MKVNGNGERAAKAAADDDDNNNNTGQQQQKPLFTVGMIADIQYAPVPDGFSYTGTPRYYRHSLEATKEAFETFRDYRYDNNDDTNGGGGGVDLVVNLGDIIDGKCQEIEKNGGVLPLKLPPKNPNSDDEGNGNDDDVDATSIALTELLEHHPGMFSLMEIENAMKSYTTNSGGRGGHNNKKNKKRRILHSYGNHCLYNLNRTELRQALGIPFRIEKPAEEGGFNIARRVNSHSDGRRREQEQEAGYYFDGNDGDDDGDLVGYYSYVLSSQQQQQQSASTTTSTESTTPESVPSSSSSSSSSGSSSSSSSTGSSSSSSSSSSSIKFIVLDGYDIALMRRSTEHSQKRKQAIEILKRENGKNYNEGNENSPEGLEGLQKRFVAFNGAVGQLQLDWLQDQLEETRQLNNSNNNNNCDQKVIIISHQPIHPQSSNPVCLIWNYDEVLEILQHYSDVVVASFSGHAHKGGYVRDEDSGIHFRVIEAVLESKPPLKTFGILDIHQDYLQLRGYGDCESAFYDFDHCERNNTNERDIHTPTPTSTTNNKTSKGGDEKVQSMSTMTS